MPLDPETAQEFGELTEAVRGLTRQLTELRREIADQGAQSHEIKHAQNGQEMKIAIMGEKLADHLLKDERDHAATIEAIKDNRTISQNTMREVADKVFRDLERHQTVQVAELAEYRQALAVDLQEIKDDQKGTKAKLEDFLTWKNKVVGGLAIVGIVLGYFAKTLIEWVETGYSSVTHH